MPDRPETPDHPSEKPAGAQPPPHGRSAARRDESLRLLGEILSRLDRMEGGLSQHEQWIRRIETEHHDVPPLTHATPLPSGPTRPDDASTAHAQDLDRLVGSLTLERDRANKALAEAERQLGQYQQELLGIRKKLADMQNRILDADRQASTLKDALEKERTQTRALQTEAHRQLHQREQQVQAVHARLLDAQKQVQARDKQLDEWRVQLEDAADRIETLGRTITESSPTAAPATAGLSKPAAIALAVAGALALIGVSLTAWTYENGNRHTTHRIVGTVVLPDTHPGTIAACEAIARRDSAIKAKVDSSRALIELSTETTDPAAGLARINRLSETMASELPKPAGLTSTTRPARDPEYRHWADEIATLDRALAAATQPAGPTADDLAALHADWQGLSSQRRQVAEQIVALRQKLATETARPPTSQVSPDQAQQAEAANRYLQAEIEALNQRETQLLGRLRVGLEAGGVQYKALIEATTQADELLATTLKDEQPEDVKTQLNLMRDALAAYRQALARITTDWQQQAQAFANPQTADALAIQAALEKSARAFVDAVGPAGAALQQALEAIGQGQDQVTKRLVLRNGLAKELAPLTQAWERALAAARSVILAEDIELGAIVQRLAGLRQQVQARRQQITGELQQAQASQRQQQQSAAREALQTQLDEAHQQAAKLDGALLDAGDRLTAALTADAARQQALAATLDLHRRRADTLARMNDREQAFLKTVESWPEPAVARSVPAHVVESIQGGPALSQAILTGLSPLILGGIAGAIVWWIIASRKSQDTMEAYARSLRLAAQRAAVPSTASESVAATEPPADNANVAAPSQAKP